MAVEIPRQSSNFKTGDRGCIHFCIRKMTSQHSRINKNGSAILAPNKPPPPHLNTPLLLDSSRSIHIKVNWKFWSVQGIQYFNIIVYDYISGFYWTYINKISFQRANLSSFLNLTSNITNNVLFCLGIILKTIPWVTTSKMT